MRVVSPVFVRLAAFAMLAMAAPLSPGLAAQDDGEETLDLAKMDRAQVLQLLRDNNDRFANEACAFRVPVTERMAQLDPANSRLELLRLIARARCADEEARYRDGLELIRTTKSRFPATPVTGLLAYFVLRLEDGEEALLFLAKLEGPEFRDLQPRNFWALVRMIRKDGLEAEYRQLALGWFDSGQIGFIDSELHAGLAQAALRASARDGRSEMAEQLIGYVIKPSDYIDMLTDRAYEPFWPQLEARAGPNLENISAEYVTFTRRRLTNTPRARDRSRFSDAAHALYYNGQFAEAIALVETWEKRMFVLTESDAWAFKIEAYAYDAMGQTERADAVFDWLAALDLLDNNWAVNLVLHRASRLVGFGRWEEGLAAAEYVWPVTGSTYADMIVAKDQACALRALGRTEEAQIELEFLRDNRADSPTLLASGLLCHDLREEAAEALIEGLRDERLRASVIDTLLGPNADLFYTQSILPNPYDLRAEFPELAEAFDANARDLPEEFTPRSALLRAKLDLPEWE